VSPEIDEKAIRNDDPKRLTIKIAHAKTDALLSHISEPAILVTIDQVVVVHGAIREKPIDEDECRTFLRSYDDTPVEVVNGTVVTNTATGKRAEGNNVVTLRFRPIPEKVIDQLIAEGDVLHCAGGLKAEHSALKRYLVSMEGTEESLQGVPIDLVKRLMEEVK